MEDPTRIEQILKELNKGLKDEPWRVAPGWHALTVVDMEGDGGFQPDSSKGLVVKTFFNVLTGEVKMFHVLYVEKKT